MDDACKKQELISDNTYETSFTKRTDLIESLLWKYTPNQLRNEIRNLHNKLEEKHKQIDDSTLNEKNKLINKQKIAYEYSTEIFKILAVVLTNSPISIEFVEMEVSGDFKDLINNIRQPEPRKVFQAVE